MKYCNKQHYKAIGTFSDGTETTIYSLYHSEAEAKEAALKFAKKYSYDAMFFKYGRYCTKTRIEGV